MSNILSVNNITKHIASLLEKPDEASSSKVRAFWHHMTPDQRALVAHVDIKENISFGDSSLAAFIGRQTKSLHDQYVAGDLKPITSNSMNTSILSIPMDNKSFVDGFASPNPVYAKYTDPAKYNVASGKSRVTKSIIDEKKKITQLKTLTEIIACKLLTLLNESSHAYTLGYVLHEMFGSLASRDMTFTSKVKAVRGGNMTYVNTSASIGGTNIRIGTPYTVAKTRTAMTAETILEGTPAADPANTKQKVCFDIRYVIPELVRVPDSVEVDVKEVAAELNKLVTSIVGLTAVDQLYTAAAIACKETGFINYGGGINLRGCHYHEDDCHCAVAGTPYDKDKPCKCGGNVPGNPHYDIETECAGFAQCDCTLSVTNTVGMFTESYLKESKYMSRPDKSLDKDSVPERLIGKPFGSFISTTDEVKEHTIAYDIPAILAKGPAFIKKFEQRSGLFKGLTPSAMNILHKHNAKGELAVGKDVAALVLISTMPWNGNFTIRMKPAITCSTFGYAIKYEISSIIANGAPVNTRSSGFAGEVATDFGGESDDEQEFNSTPTTKAAALTPPQRSSTAKKTSSLPEDVDLELDEAAVAELNL